jgi:hypothetical protein
MGRAPRSSSVQQAGHLGSGQRRAAGRRREPAIDAFAVQLAAVVFEWQEARPSIAPEAAAHWMSGCLKRSANTPS